MKFISNNSHQKEQLICKLEKKWGLYISCCFDLDSDYVFSEEITRAVKFLKIYPMGSWEEQYKPNSAFQVMLSEGGLFLFDTQKEMEEHYDMVVGDNGPTKSNPYDGPLRVYALTISNEGECLTENT